MRMAQVGGATARLERTVGARWQDRAMPPRRRTAPPPIDVDDLRARLDQGKIVRVAIAHSAQFPEGTVGRVRSLGDPDVDGDEFIHVELSVNGTRDLLPFAPADLTAPARASAVKNGSAAGSTNGSKPATNGAAGAGRGHSVAGPAAAPPGEPLVGPAAPAGSANGSATSTNGAAPVNGGPGHGATSLPSPTASPVNGATAPGGGPAPAVDRIFFGATPPKTAPETTPRPKAVRTAKPTAKRRGPAVAISIGTTDTDPPHWRLEAKVGAKVVVRNGSVPPARVWELVGMLGDETLTRAVGTVLDEQRQAAQPRADALAAELAAVQAELAELPEPTG